MRAYEKLPVAEKNKIRAILYIMYKFSISWEAYHTFTTKATLNNDSRIERQRFQLIHRSLEPANGYAEKNCAERFPALNL